MAEIDEQFAEFAINASFRASRELIQILDMAEPYCSPQEYEDLKQRLAFAIAEIGDINRWVFKTHPHMAAIVEQRLEKYGRFC